MRPSLWLLLLLLCAPAWAQPLPEQTPGRSYVFVPIKEIPLAGVDLICTAGTVSDPQRERDHYLSVKLLDDARRPAVARWSPKRQIAYPVVDKILSRIITVCGQRYLDVSTDAWTVAVEEWRFSDPRERPSGR